MLYKFEHTKTGELHEVEMSMKDYEPYKGPNGDDEHWQRVYEAPQISMGVSTAKSIDPWDNNSFVNRTKQMQGSYGEMYDHAEELSAKRAKESFTPPVTLHTGPGSTAATALSLLFWGSPGWAAPPAKRCDKSVSCPPQRRARGMTRTVGEPSAASRGAMTRTTA